MDFLKRAWVEIDIEALKNNYDIICKKSESRIIPVVKADAYGHSATDSAIALTKCGADFFAVSNVLEAIELRNAGIMCDILVLGYTPIDSLPLLTEYNITQSIYSYDYAVALGDAAENSGVSLKCHLKLDTGMGRIGFNCRNSLEDINEIENALKIKNLDFKGVFTHFAVADSETQDDITFTDNQYKNFIETIEKIEQKGIDLGIKHCCNSAGILAYPDMKMDAVRAGIILYGLSPSDEVSVDNDFSPVMSMYSAVSMVKTVGCNTAVSYGRTYNTAGIRKIATISAGYADGVPRLLSNNGYVFINNKKAPIVGRICMDQFCVDVTDVGEVKIGDVVEIFGKNISVDIVAKEAQTINYEIICGISKRIPRVFINK